MVCEMETVYRTIGVLCVTAFVSGLLLNIVNITYMQKVVRMILVMSIISAVFFNGSKPAYKLFYKGTESGISDYEIQESEEYVLQQAETEIENRLSDELNVKNLSYYDIEVNINKENGIVQISDITIYGAENEKDIRTLLSDTVSRERLYFK